MPTAKPLSETETSSNLSDTVSRAAENVQSKIKEMGNAAAEKFDENRTTAASGLEGAAENLHQRAEQLPIGENLSHMAHSAADKLSSTADYVRRNDLNSMLGDVEALVKKNPVPALLVATGLGFLLARAFSGDSRV